MFNKPNLFPKPGEAAPTRAVLRTGTPGSGDVQTSRSQSSGMTANASTQPPEPTVRQAEVEKTKSDSRLIVGPEVKLKGAEILDCDTLVVEGRVAATMDSRVLRIAEGGAFEGTVGVDVAEIHGRFDGELTVREQLVIHASGRVNGKIRYGKIFIEEGGQICGDIMASEADGRRERKPVSAPSTETAEAVSA